MKNQYNRIALLATLLLTTPLFGQNNVGINTETPHSSAVLDVVSTEKGILVPRMSAAQRDAIATPAAGLLVYVNDESKFYYFDGSIWKPFLIVGDGADNLGDHKALQTINTNGNWVSGDADGEGVFIDVNGKVGVGTATPQHQLHVINDIQVGSVLLGDANLVSNTRVGEQVLELNTTGIDNTAVGYHALSMNSEGSYNTALGSQSLSANTTGTNNIAIGRRSLQSNTIAGSNIGLGTGALLSNIDGTSNVAIGVSTLKDNISGGHNVAIGNQAMTTNLGSNNIGIGHLVMGDNTTGEYNLALGTIAGYDNTTGSYNTFLGYNTGRGITTGSNNTILGARVTGLSSTLSNSIAIASGDGAIKIFSDADGNTGIGTTNPGEDLEVNSNDVAININDANGVAGGLTHTMLNFQTGGTTVGGLGVYSSSGTMTLTNRYNGIFFQTGSDGTATTKAVLTNSGNLGIGTIFPTERLTVAGAIRMNDGNEALGRIMISDANGVASWADASSLDDGDWISSGNDLYSGVSGNIGIGATDPVGKLQLGADFISGSGGLNLYVTSDGSATQGNPQQYFTSDIGMLITENSNNTTGPDKIGLTLHNDNSTDGAYSPMMLFSARESGSSQYKTALAGLYAEHTGNGAEWIDGKLHLATASSSGAGLVSRMAINKAGQVGIGITSPNATLHVVGSDGWILSDRASTNLTNRWGRFGTSHYNLTEEPFMGLMNRSDATSNNVLLGGGSSVANAATNIILYTAEDNTTTLGSERMRVASDGNVGIGTNAPLRKLDVNGQARLNLTPADTDGLELMHSTVNTMEAIGFYHAGTLYSRLNSNVDGLNFVNGSGSTLLKIKTDGNVGIGTITPTKPFHVVGEMRFETGAEGVGKVLVSDATGVADWAAASTINDGNGIYSGDGTTPADVDVTVTDNVDFDGGTFFIDGTNNRIGVGTTTPSTKFQLKANSTSEFTTSFNVQTPTDNSLFEIRNNGDVYLNNSDANRRFGFVTDVSSNFYGINVGQNTQRGIMYPGSIFNGGTATDVSQTGVVVSNTRVSNAPLGYALFVTRQGTETANFDGSTNLLVVGHKDGESFSPASNTVNWAALKMIPNINQTGSSVGEVRGLWLKPTLQGLTGSFKGIDLDFNNGQSFGVYQSGSATKNYFAGRVGVGTESPEIALHVVGDGFRVSDPTAGRFMTVQPQGAFRRLHLQRTGDGSNNPSTSGAFSIFSTGGAGDITMMDLIAGTGAEARINFGDAGDADVGKIAYNNATNSLSFTTATNESMRIDNTGNVGIGTSSPSAKIHVNGNAVIASDLNVGNSRINLSSSGPVGLIQGSVERLAIQTKNASNVQTTRLEFSANGTESPVGFRNVSGVGINIPLSGHATEALDVNGKLRLRGGTPGNGKVLVSDADGVGEWKSISEATKSYIQITANYTATLTDEIIAVDASSGAVTVTLPTAVGITGKQLKIKKTDNSSNSMVISANGAELIDGASTQTTNVAYSGYVLVSDGSNWLIFGRI